VAEHGTMRLLGAVLGAVVLTGLGATAVTAHIELVSSSPAAGANLSTPPAEVTITFDDELEPGSSFTVTGGGSVEVGTGEVDLTVADRNMMTGPVAITEPGTYTVIYTAAGVDGHEVAGIFSFGYLATATIPVPTGDEGPDTAITAPSHSPALLFLGVMSVAAAAVILLRRIMEAR
jgi:methionine-rich copper-binding protein CopC